ncbi:MAG: glycosyltransferase family 2 protein [Candidatus Glassbacteria bacterium]
MKLSVIIPVFNEKHTIQEITKRVLNVPIEKEVIIVDDFSTDGTREILREMEKDYPIRVIYSDRNHGRGMAVRMGQEIVTGELLINQDADLEYDPNDYDALIKPIVEDEADVVYGSRFLGNIEGMAWKNYLGNKFLTFLTNLALGSKITDLMTAYKVFKTEDIKKLRFDTEGFEFEAELTAKMVRMGCRIVDVPISYHGRGEKEGKKIGWRDAIKVMSTLKKYR